MDRLTPLLNHFSLRAGIFYTGNICGIHDFHHDASQGHIHLIKRGPVQVIGVRKEIMNITEPTILFLPRPDTHRLVADEQTGADVVCATVKFGAGGGNPITDSLPAVVEVELAALPRVHSLLDLMFDARPAAQTHCLRRRVRQRERPDPRLRSKARLFTNGVAEAFWRGVKA